MKKDNKEYVDWCELFEYVRKEILEYDSNMKMPKYMILRLRGLRDGKFMANKKQSPLGSYEYKTILMTFKLCKSKINSYIQGNKSKFNNEQHKFNGVMIIIENEINNVVEILKKSNKSENKTKSLELKHQVNDNAGYKSNNKKSKINKNLEELW